MNSNPGDISGYSSAQPLDIHNVLNFLWSLLKTGQLAYTVVAAGVLMVLGFALAYSGDNTGRKMWILGIIGSVVAGGVLVWGAPWLSSLIGTATATVGK